MYKVRLFGHDGSGKNIQRDLKSIFETANLAIEAAENTVIDNSHGFQGAPTHYRITGNSGASLLNVRINGAKRQCTEATAYAPDQPSKSRGLKSAARAAVEPAAASWNPA